MTVPDHVYQKVLTSVSKTLRLPGRPSEASIIEHCSTRMAAVIRSTKCSPQTLVQLLGVAAAHVDLDIREVHSETDLDQLLKEFPPGREPVMARVPSELGTDTDAFVMRRSNREPWEKAYLAVINCRDYHFHRRYFSKWHEIAHLLLEGGQMTFAFRRTRESDHADPLERLVDKVAGQLAFFAPIFKPVLEAHTRAEGRLSFAVIDRVREQAAAEASRLSTRMASVHHNDTPVMYFRAAMGLRKAQRRLAATPDFFPELPSGIEPRLRVKESFVSPAARRLGLELFPNVSLSGSNLLKSVYDTSVASSAVEEFSSWRDGLPRMTVHVEALKQDDEIHCLVQTAPSTNH